MATGFSVCPSRWRLSRARRTHEGAKVFSAELRFLKKRAPRAKIHTGVGHHLLREVNRFAFQILRELERSHPPGMVFTFGSLQTPCLSDGTGRPDRQQSLAKLPSLRSGEILFLCPTHIPKGIDGQISFVLIRVLLMDRSCGIRQRTFL